MKYMFEILLGKFYFRLVEHVANNFEFDFKRVKSFFSEKKKHLQKSVFLLDKYFVFSVLLLAHIIWEFGETIAVKFRRTHKGKLFFVKKKNNNNSNKK